MVSQRFVAACLILVILCANGCAAAITYKNPTKMTDAELVNYQQELKEKIFYGDGNLGKACEIAGAIFPLGNGLFLLIVGGPYWAQRKMLINKVQKVQDEIERRSAISTHEKENVANLSIKKTDGLEQVENKDDRPHTNLKVLNP
jgi:hypothetical protein